MQLFVLTLVIRQIGELLPLEPVGGDREVVHLEGVEEERDVALQAREPPQKGLEGDLGRLVQRRLLKLLKLPLTRLKTAQDAGPQGLKPVVRIRNRVLEHSRLLLVKLVQLLQPLPVVHALSLL